MSILSQILAEKQKEVAIARKRRPIAEFYKQVARMDAPLSFIDALKQANRPALIAEVKKASPSRGVIREDFDHVAIAQTYASNGAACLSVLTDKPYFQGRLAHFSEIRHAVGIPLLRKDFIVDEYQIVESRAAGADALLLIVAALKFDELTNLLNLTREYGMEALVEVHDAKEMALAGDAGAKMIGVNNRDLHTFLTSLQTTIGLISCLPKDTLLVSESGINSWADVDKLRTAGADAILVGEALMREKDIGSKVRELTGQSILAGVA